MNLTFTFREIEAELEKGNYEVKMTYNCDCWIEWYLYEGQLKHSTHKEKCWVKQTLYIKDIDIAYRTWRDCLWISQNVAKEDREDLWQLLNYQTSYPALKDGLEGFLYKGYYEINPLHRDKFCRALHDFLHELYDDGVVPCRTIVGRIYFDKKGHQEEISLTKCAHYILKQEGVLAWLAVKNERRNK